MKTARTSTSIILIRVEMLVMTAFSYSVEENIYVLWLKFWADSLLVGISILLWHAKLQVNNDDGNAIAHARGMK